MARTLIAALALVVSAGVAAAQPAKPDRKLIQKLEKRLADAEQQHAGELAALRKTYGDLEERLASPTDQGRARLIAELARVLEPVLAEARGIGGGSRTKRKKLGDHFKKKVPAAVARIEDPALKTVSGYVSTRLQNVLTEGGSIDDALDLTHETWARRALEDLLDADKEFALRWNGLIAGHLAQVASFTKCHAVLVKARNDLAIARDPLIKWQIGAPKGFALVPTGAYVMLNTAGFGGSGIRKKNRKFTLKQGVYIGLNEVTNREYLAWLETIKDKDERLRHLPRDTTGRKILWPADPESGEYMPDADALDRPVVGVRLASALAYAASRGARLPTEEEWCACASGPDQRPYPWGKEWVEGLCNSKEAQLGETIAVGSFADGRGPFGHFDLAGNVMEWTLTYDSGKRIDPEGIKDTMAVIRGGNFTHSQRDVSTGWVYYRRALFDQDVTLGFRLAMDR